MVATDCRPISGDDDDIEVVYYPSPVSRKTPSWLGKVRNHRDSGYRYLAELLREIYAAVRGKQHRLAAMGLRSVLEYLMVIIVGDQGSFGKNLDNFHAKGYISTIQFDAVKTALEVGHATTHRGFDPSGKDLDVMLDIVEGVIAAIVVHPASATELERRVPARKKT